MIVGCVTLVVDQHAAVRLRDVAADVLRASGLQHREVVRLCARDVARRADRLGHRRTHSGRVGPQADHHRSRRSSQSCSARSIRSSVNPLLLPVVGLLLMIPIYVLVALLFAIYVPELFPTEVRLRASGICNTLGRGATIVTPFIVVALFAQHGIVGVLALMIGLLAIQIVVVAWLGVEPTGRRLEDLQPTDTPASAKRCVPTRRFRRSSNHGESHDGYSQPSSIWTHSFSSTGIDGCRARPRRMDIVDPATGAVIGTLAAASEAGRRPRGARGSPRVRRRGMARPVDPAARSRAEPVRRSVRSGPRKLLQARDAEQRPTDLGNARADFTFAAVLPLFRSARADAAQRRDSSRRSLPVLHAARAARCRRADDVVQPSVDDPVEKPRAGARYRQQRRDQGIGTDAAHDGAARASAEGGRRAEGRRQCGQRRRHGGGRGVRETSAGPQDRVHGRHRCRPFHRRSRRAQLRVDDTRTRRQGRGDPVRRHRHRSRGERRGIRRVHRCRADLRVRRAHCSCRSRFTTQFLRSFRAKVAGDSRRRSGRCEDAAGSGDFRSLAPAHSRDARTRRRPTAPRC